MSDPTHEEQVEFYRDKGELFNYYMFKRLEELTDNADEIRTELMQKKAWVGLSKWFNPDWSYEEFKQNLDIIIE